MSATQIGTGDRSRRLGRQARAGKFAEQRHFHHLHRGGVIEPEAGIEQRRYVSEEKTDAKLTDTLDRAASCLRDLWNEYFYVGNDDMSSYPHEIQDLSEEAETRLFGALVLFKLDRLDFMAKYRAEAAPFLIVVPATDPKPRLLVGRPSQDANRYFDALDQRVGPNDVTLNFIEWFDWNRYGERQFEYYFVTINTFAAHPEFEGRGALIERKNTRVFFDSNAG